MTSALADIPLYGRAPSLTTTAPRLALGHFPTVIDRIALDVDGAAVPVLVKRDDLCADGYAGNKVRKLEFLLAEAQARGATRLITAGAAGSHHAFATAYHGTRAGFDVSLVLFPQPLNHHVRGMLALDAAVGAELCWASRMETVPYGIWRARSRHRSEPTYVVPPGGSSDLGSFGYINGALELADQIAADTASRPSSVYVAAGTLGTVVGIAIGLAWAGVQLPVQAIRITTRLLTNERMLAQLARATLNRLRACGAADVPDLQDVLRLVTLRHDFIGRGYGRATKPGERATAIFAGSGLQLDPTYTAKAAAALLSDVAAAGADQPPPLFWHTLSAVEPSHLLEQPGATPVPAHFARYLDG
jgi:1-aminocyclopropane-1-carboxylate deaminase/D-cysteine desulfhydrase-like pyridoxal-dependent ACC family enzyme